MGQAMTTITSNFADRSGNWEKHLEERMQARDRRYWYRENKWLRKDSGAELINNNRISWVF